MRNLLTILFATTLISCSVDLRQVPSIREQSNILHKENRILYIGSFDVFIPERDTLNKAWKISLISLIQSKRIFKDVKLLPKDLRMLADDYLILDLEIIPHYSDKYNWWITWPAVYPMSAYWPLQVRTGTYDVNLKYNLITKDRKILSSMELKVKHEETNYFYGFFRTTDFEKMIEISNLEVMELCAKSLIELFP